MNQVETKQHKSIYHIFIWIAVFSLIMIGLLEWGYIAGGRAFGNYKVLYWSCAMVCMDCYDLFSNSP